MSQVYSTEPSPTGRIVLTTTHGPIDINLFCKECPTTTRMFIQLCLDGYYDNMIFHRVLPDFLVQTGLTRGSNNANNDDISGEARGIEQYLRKSSAVPPSSSGSADALGWERKKLEVNPRIRFNHRGQVAAAFPLKDTSETDDENLMLRYQFFVTLDESPFLDGNHVVFGTIAGPTIFNALRIGKTDVDEATGTPVDMTDSPPRITSVKVDYHPFQDLVVTPEKLLPWKIANVKSEKGHTEVEKRRKKRKGKKDFNVLSFGDEEKDYEAVVKNDGAIQSSHDVLHKESEFLAESVDADLKKKVEEKEDVRNGEKVKRKSKDGGSSERKKKAKIEHKEFSADTAEMDKPTFQPKQPNAIDKTSEPVVNESEPIAKQPEIVRDEPQKPKKSKPTTIGAVEARRAKYLKSGHSLASKKERMKREDDTMAKLMAFRSKVIETKGSAPNPTENGSTKLGNDDSLASRMASRAKQAKDEEARIHQEKEEMISKPGYHGQVDNDSDNETPADWLGTKFNCKKHVDRNSRLSAFDKGDFQGGDGRHMDDYLVVDEKKGRKGSRHGRHRDGERFSHKSHKSDHRRRDDHHRR